MLSREFEQRVNAVIAVLSGNELGVWGTWEIGERVGISSTEASSVLEYLIGAGVAYRAWDGDCGNGVYAPCTYTLTPFERA